MESAVISSLIVAFVTGITFLAYKHPIAFKRMYFPIFVVLLLIVVGFSAWNFAISITLASLKEFIPPEQFQAATLKAHALDAPSWYSLAFSGMVVYLVFLLWLPNIIEDEKKDKPKGE